MPPCIDCYVLTDDRSPAAVQRFLDHFLPRRHRLAADYPVPHLEDPPAATFQTPEELLTHVLPDPAAPYVLYWGADVAEGLIRYAIVAPTRDGKLVLGLSVDDDRDGDVPALLAQLRAFTGAQHAYAALEDPPALSEAEFFAGLA
jgi:hypothetical protein